MISSSSMLLTLALGSLAAAPSASDPASSRREGGHTFMLSEFVPSPFATTEFAMLTGIGYATADVGGQGYSLLSLAQTTRLQVAPTSWLALRVAATGYALGGADQDSALTLGGSFGHALGGGALLSIPLGALRLGVSVDVERRSSYAFSILGAIQASVLADRVDASTLLAKTEDWTLRPGAQVALALGQTLGVYGHVAYERESSTPEGGASTAGNAIRGGLAASIDLLPSTGVPIGLLGTYDLQHTTGDAVATVHRAGAGLFYTGRSSVSIGAEGQVEIHPEAQGISMNIYGAYFGMRYYW